MSKTKPVELLRQAYEAGQRDFGENYVQVMPLVLSDWRQETTWLSALQLLVGAAETWRHAFLNRL